MSGIALKTYTRPIESLLAEPDVSEICINSHGCIWVDRIGQAPKMEVHEELDYDHLEAFAELVAEHNKQDVTMQAPIMSGMLPGGYRIQIIKPPACEIGKVVISIRKQVVKDLSINDYIDEGAMTDAQANDIQKAVQKNKVIMISGGTYCGKTTLLNAVIKLIDDGQRIVTIEDVRELRATQPNSVSLLYARGEKQGVSHHDATDLLQASLRLRPDRIILGELRGEETFAFLRASITGHPGMSSIHADSIDMCFEQIALMVMQARMGLGRSEIMAFAREAVGMVIQMERTKDGRRVVSEVHGV